mgnify:FL=1
MVEGQKAEIKPRIWFSHGLWRCRINGHLACGDSPFKVWLKASRSGGFWVCKPELCQYCEKLNVNTKEMIECLWNRGLI